MLQIFLFRRQEVLIDLKRYPLSWEHTRILNWTESLDVDPILLDASFVHLAGRSLLLWKKVLTAMTIRYGFLEKMVFRVRYSLP